MLSGFYADAAKERSVVEAYVRNQQGGANALGDQVGELIDERLKAKTVSAELRTLSRVIAEQKLDRIDLLKVNVEKSELDVLLGVAAADWPKIAQLVIEVDESANLEPITRLLGEQGYDVLVEQDPLLRKTELCYVYAVRRGDAQRRLAAESARRPLPQPDDEVLAPASLRAHLKAHLPRHMIPSSFVLLDELPLDANGKIDRAALPAIAHDPAPRPATRAATATEKALAGIWSALLDVPSIGPEDDFFDLGGGSLLAIQAVARIQEVFQVDVPLRNLFEAPTLASLAGVIDRLAWAAAGAPPGTNGGASAEREEIVL